MNAHSTNYHMVHRIRSAFRGFEILFDVPLSTSDKMYLKNYITQFADERGKKITFSAAADGMLKFLMIHYDFKDIRKFKNVMYNGKPDATLNRTLRERWRNEDES